MNDVLEVLRRFNRTIKVTIPFCVDGTDHHDWDVQMPNGWRCRDCKIEAIVMRDTGKVVFIKEEIKKK